MLTCPKCNYDNELGRIFCHTCGTKLDLSQIKPPGQGGPKLKKKKGGSSTWRLVRTLLELFVLIGMGVSVFLALQVVPLPDKKTADEDRAMAERKRGQLEMLLARGRPGKLDITEGQLNAFLGSLRMDDPITAWLVFAPQSVRMELHDGAVKVFLWGELRVGSSLKKQLYFTYVTTPRVRNGRFFEEPKGGYIGSLPIHPVLIRHFNIVRSFVAGVFGKMDRERTTLAKLSSINLQSRSATLDYQPRTN